MRSVTSGLALSKATTQIAVLGSKRQILIGMARFHRMPLSGNMRFGVKLTAPRMSFVATVVRCLITTPRELSMMALAGTVRIN